VCAVVREGNISPSETVFYYSFRNPSIILLDNAIKLFLSPALLSLSPSPPFGNKREGILSGSMGKGKILGLVVSN